MTTVDWLRGTFPSHGFTEHGERVIDAEAIPRGRAELRHTLRREAHQAFGPEREGQPDQIGGDAAG